MSSKVFDYIIIGSGASGLQLALAFIRDSYFKNKSIGIIEKRKAYTNDKTWSFWEEGDGLYDDIVYKSWNKGEFSACGETIGLDLKKYNYKMLRSIDFYKHATAVIEKNKNIECFQDEIIKVEDLGNHVRLNGNEIYKAKHVFDSRLPQNFKPKDSLNILQHFKGWFIETEQDVFTPDKFCMMDYSIGDKSKTCFMYILPFTERKGFVEFTYFSPNLVDDETYEKYIKRYLSEKLNIENYKITETEKGIIPMSSYPFYKQHSAQITKIGTAGGWVKASTGYSFKNAERFALKIVKNIKSNKSPHDKLHKKRFKHYDKLFLDVLFNYNAYGEELFYKMYKRNNIYDIFKFLDDESHFGQELKIIISMTSHHFIKALIKHALGGFKIK
jgi:lycopene beta-cyclase